MLVALAAVNAIFIAWATVLDARHSSALARALGASPRQVVAGLSAAQLIPALGGAILGIPGGIGLFASVKHGGGPVVYPIAWLIAVVPGPLLVMAVLTAIPARIGARRPVAGHPPLRSHLSARGAAPLAPPSPHAPSTCEGTPTSVV